MKYEFGASWIREGQPTLTYVCDNGAATCLVLEGDSPVTVSAGMLSTLGQPQLHSPSTAEGLIKVKTLRTLAYMMFRALDIVCVSVEAKPISRSNCAADLRMLTVLQEFDELQPYVRNDRTLEICMNIPGYASGTLVRVAFLFDHESKGFSLEMPGTLLDLLNKHYRLLRILELRTLTTKQ